MSRAQFSNRVKTLRQARGWTQDELAQAAGLSRTGVSAIEAERLIPSVAAALALARALDCTVEKLFGQARAEKAVEFAWAPTAFPCRYWLAEVGGRTFAYPVESCLRGDVFHDGVARDHADPGEPTSLSSRTLVVATCDPAAGLLATAFERRTGSRMLLLSRSSGEALELLSKGLVHAAGIHFAAVGDRGGNAAALLARQPHSALDLLHVAQWEEGLASRPAAHLRSTTAAVRGNLRWVGRVSGAAARRQQDELLGKRRAPRRLAPDHRGVALAIRNDWADVGVCVRLVCEEAGLAFMPLERECYDLCIPQAFAHDTRVVQLIAAVQSPEYRRLLGELPGYGPQRSLGEIEHVLPMG